MPTFKASPATIVLLHANAESSLAWYTWVPLLARRFRVVRPERVANIIGCYRSLGPGAWGGLTIGKSLAIVSRFARTEASARPPARSSPAFHPAHVPRPGKIALDTPRPRCNRRRVRAA